MPTPIEDYFGNPKAFTKSIPLHMTPDATWEEVSALSPSLSKGWFELSKLDNSVRLEFIRDYWFNALPYLPHIYAFLDRFFAGVEEVGIYLASPTEKDPLIPFMVYRLANRSDFFLGAPPLLEEEIDGTKQSISFPLPEDFCAFLRIHDGFQKGGDTGIFPTRFLESNSRTFQERAPKIKYQNAVVDPKALFPFYQSFKLDIYQCFYENWYPDGQMGNVLCSLSEGSISQYKNHEKVKETLAFQSFLDWLAFYLEGIEG